MQRSRPVQLPKGKQANLGEGGKASHLTDPVGPEVPERLKTEDHSLRPETAEHHLPQRRSQDH